MNIRMKPDALWPAYQTIEQETSMTEQKRRLEDQLPEQRLDWSRDGEPSSTEIRIERQQALLNSAEAMLRAANTASTAAVFPDSEPRKYVVVGTADAILRLLPLSDGGDGGLEEFAEFVAKNYPPETFIADPMWHASRLYRAALYAARNANPAEAPDAGPHIAAIENIKCWEQRAEDDGHSQAPFIYCRAEIGELRAYIADHDMHLRATIREITRLLVDRQNVDHLMNDPDLVALLSALTVMAVRRAMKGASPAAAPAAGQAELAKLQRYDHLGCLMVPDATGDYYSVADVEALFATLAAPVLTSPSSSDDGSYT